jgi:hypothetical protein
MQHQVTQMCLIIIIIIIIIIHHHGPLPGLLLNQLQQLRLLERRALIQKRGGAHASAFKSHDAPPPSRATRVHSGSGR